MRRFRKNLFSGELEEVDDDPAVEFAAQNARVRERTAWMVTKRRRFASPWDTGKDVINRNMSLKPEDATPERIAAENEAARRHNTGAWYDSKGQCHIAKQEEIIAGLEAQGLDPSGARNLLAL